MRDWWKGEGWWWGWRWQQAKELSITMWEPLESGTGAKLKRSRVIAALASKIEAAAPYAAWRCPETRQPISGETQRRFGHLLHQAFLCIAASRATFIVYRFEFNVFILYSFILCEAARGRGEKSRLLINNKGRRRSDNSCGGNSSNSLANLRASWQKENKMCLFFNTVYWPIRIIHSPNTNLTTYVTYLQSHTRSHAPPPSPPLALYSWWKPQAVRQPRLQKLRSAHMAVARFRSATTRTRQ